MSHLSYLQKMNTTQITEPETDLIVWAASAKLDEDTHVETHILRSLD